MNMYFKSSKKRKKHTILDLLNFNNLFFNNDILLYDNDNYDEDYNYNEDYDYVIIDDDLKFNYDDYKDDTIYYL
ncbi:hypothetical protein [Romboutsia sp.]|uniref:hypothetical protein n=1 Tax=Romboutsia sp. TaxID=1965302 RepID=UPI002B71D505|nr:hypothetical protein [Romboutsia sp.]HSQ89687.1 hypothetical protein [Romboutsia sp.]